MVINVEEIKNKILAFLNEKGPSLPVHVAKNVNLSWVFASAILSELIGEKKVILSSMKIGSSPLYLLPGQGILLENWADNLGGVEKTAFLKLKENKILHDEIQEPAIRVALRSLKDFAIPIKIEEKLYWKYFILSNEDIKSLVISKIQKTFQKPSSQETQKELAKKQDEEKKEPAQMIKNSKKQPKNQKFLEDIKSFLEKKDIGMIKELYSDNKEFTAKAMINSGLGKLGFLIIAKNKKKPSPADIILAYQKAIDEKMPCYLIVYEEPSKKTRELLEDYKNIVKVEKIS